MEKDAEQPEPFKGMYAMNVKFFNKQVTYVLTRDCPENTHTGLRLLDMESTIKKQHCNMIMLKNIDFGVQRDIAFSHRAGRLCFQNSLKQLIICPLLHQNTNKLLGANESDNYILSK